MNLKELQAPLKERYRSDPGASQITLVARGSEAGAPAGCSVDLGRAIQQAEAHTGEKTERYCTVLQTLRKPPAIRSGLAGA